MMINEKQCPYDLYSPCEMDDWENWMEQAEDLVAWGMEYENDAKHGDHCNHVFHYYLNAWKEI